ncbi:MAG: RagB/SusD family nutrient uptake outer membrane protein [Prevotellaceae bacterium]|jgi:hypothetical protein|nr:RagB/SusD family nutrient uptake outer membrane protein [Prevotellaceae bacterium]
MKQFKNIILLCTTAALTASCGNGWLDLQPSTSVNTGEALNYVGDAKYALNGIYSAMQDAYLYSGRVVYYADVTGDDMQAVSSTKRTGSYYLFSYTPDNAPSTHWSYLYSMIQSCNTILDIIDDLPLEGASEKDRADYKGQALTLRALALFDLTRIYGYPYTKDSGASLGVPVVKTQLLVADKPARNTVAECYAAIIDDLTQAVTLLGDGYNKGRVNKWAAEALLSRVYLYKGDNQNALTTGQDAIKGAEENNYELWSNADYPTAWGNDAGSGNPGEVLFEIVNTTTDSPGKESLGYLNSYSGYDDYCITTSFYAMLRDDPDDVRLKLLKFDGKKYAYVNKYQPQEGETIQDANIPLLRLSEVYLNVAEAAFKLGNVAVAAQYLNPIVERANPERHVEAANLTLGRILIERRKELVAEGHRLYDAMRNGLKCHRYDVPSKDIASTAKLTGTYPDEYDWTYYKIVLPIPKAEMDTNPNMKQNPEY